MCINKKTILNRKYTMNKKNGGNVPVLHDIRQKYVAVPCGQCYVCKRKKAREWRMRLAEDIKENKNGKVILLTFSTEGLKELAEECKGLTGYELDNEICRVAVKRFRERWRKRYGRSIRHWLITELGHGKTEHIHMHGILWTDERYELRGEFMDEVKQIWKYGWIGRGKKDWKTGKWINYVNEKTANYFVKYIMKKDEKHSEYKQIILTSAGIGKAFLESEKIENNKYNGKETNQMYNVDNGTILPMPEYFRRKMYTDEEREKLTGIVYNQGNDWTTNLKTLEDLHKPALDKIGYQNLITDQMAYWETKVNADYSLTTQSAGKQPAWQWYRTSYDDALGHMANVEDYKVFGREYGAEIIGGIWKIKDLTTYIDPTKFNDVFAIKSLDAMNFDVQVGMDAKITLTMSEEVIPNL